MERKTQIKIKTYLVDVSEIFIFFCSGREKGVGGARRVGGGGSVFFIEISQRGAVSRGGGAEGPGGCAANWGIGGGGGGA